MKCRIIRINVSFLIWQQIWKIKKRLNKICKILIHSNVLTKLAIGGEADGITLALAALCGDRMLFFLVVPNDIGTPISLLFKCFCDSRSCSAFISGTAPFSSTVFSRLLVSSLSHIITLWILLFLAGDDFVWAKQTHSTRIRYNIAEYEIVNSSYKTIWNAFVFRE